MTTSLTPSRIPIRCHNTVLALAVCLAGWVGIAGCGSGAGAGASVVRDSSGIAIVESTGSGWDAENAWRFAASPEVSIGQSEAAPEQQLYEVSSALRLDDGSIVVANSGTSELRFYDADGRHIRTVGRRGEGPGEFAGSITLFRWGADSLVAWDTQQRRVSVFTTGGEFGRAFQVNAQNNRASPRPVALFGDGSILIRNNRVFSSNDVEGGISRDSTALYRIALDGTELDSLGMFATSESFVTILDGGFMVTRIPFSRNLFVTTHGNEVYIARGNSFEIEVLAMNGSLQRIVRMDLPNAAVTPEDVEAYRQERLAEVADDPEEFKEMIERQFQATPFPEQMPPYSGITVDRSGNLWVRQYQGPTIATPAPWLVFDANGRYLGEVAGIDKFVPYELGDDYVLGRRTDDLDVEKVQLFRIVRPTPN